MGQPAEFVRFGLILCRGRSGATGSIPVEFSSHGPLTMRFFDVQSDSASEPVLDAAALGQRLGIPQAKDWKGLFDSLRASGKARPIVNAQLSGASEHRLGYAAGIQAEKLVKSEAEIYYAAAGAEAEKLMTVALERVSGSWEK
jgi:hypothetical protein